MPLRRPLAATNFQSFSSNSNKNQDIFLKFSAFIYHMFAQIFSKNFGHNSNSLPATAHFGQNFGRLQRPYLLRYFKKKKTGEVLDLYESPDGRNFQYLQKNGVFNFFAEPRRPPSRCPWLIPHRPLKIQIKTCSIEDNQKTEMSIDFISLKCIKK